MASPSTSRPVSCAPPGSRVLRQRTRRRHAPLAGLLLAAACASGAVAAPGAAAGGALAASPLESPRLLWLRHDGRLAGAPDGTDVHASLRAPLGSVWKLFVHGYLQARGATEPPYRCERGPRREDEEYCCEPGESIARDEALARSCGPYFEPARLSITPGDWRAFWHRQAAPDWLLALGALQPGTVVELPQLLQALRSVPDPARLAARQALLPNTLRDPAVLAALGSGARFKTWSWMVQGRRTGGAAGWLADGTPFWFGASGTSRVALARHAGWIGAQWQALGLAGVAPEPAALSAQPCVRVRMFRRYPLRSVLTARGTPAAPGPMRGRHTLRFENGQVLAIDALPVLRLLGPPHAPRIEARLPLEDYVARVIDREGDARERAAAQALAVAARSWLLQNAPERQGCHEVEDDSRAQRVSPNPPGEAAREAAAFTEGLVLRGADVRYHLDQGGPNVMAWQDAVRASRAGASFVAILLDAYPRVLLAGLDAHADCEPLAQAAQWLLSRQRRWRALLHAEPGFEPLGEELQVCRLAHGVPHADQRRLLIRVGEWNSREGRLTLVHEFVHLAFRHHPRGRDEAFVERLAQRLVDL